MPREPTAQEIIRESQEFEQRRGSLGKSKEWGLVFYRCTYKSQEKWDKFMSIIQELAKEYLKKDKDQDLWENLKWTVIEDPKLDRADYMEVSRWFGEWVKTELTREEFKNEALVDGRTLDDYYSAVNFPRHEFFLYVDEEVLDSFVDLDKASDRHCPGHFFTLVSQVYVLDKRGKKERRARKLAGKSLPEDEELAQYHGDDSDEDLSGEEDFSARHWNWQRFRARDLVVVYASLFQGMWPDFFVDDDEIGEVLHI
jgi:hypothetical protein